MVSGPTSFLIRLSKYRASETTAPFENFFTEAFAFALELIAPLRERFLKRLCDIDTAGRQCTICTQKVLPDGLRPDLFIAVGESEIYIESKVWSDLSQYEKEVGKVTNQVQEYRESILKSQPHGMPVKAQLKLITARPVFGLAEYGEGTLTFRPERDYRRWADVYKILQDVRRDFSLDILCCFVVDNLLALMEENDMTPFQGVGRELKAIAESYDDVSRAATTLRARLESSFRQLMEEIVKESGQKISRRTTTHLPKTSQPGEPAGPQELYTVVYIQVGKGRAWIGICLGGESFLELSARIESKHLTTDGVQVLQDQHGYGKAPWRGWIGSTVQLPMASGEEMAQRQISEGADFIKKQVALWDGYWKK